jgi:hypothetical protein
MDFNASPYYDDFEATNGALEENYMRILFRPGYAVQARELTQIQSILQNQIKQFGNHIFQDGSPVVGGHLTLDTSINYVKLDAQFNNVDIDLEDYFGLVVFNSDTPKTRAKVIQTYSTTTDRALLIKYLRGSAFTSSQTISTAAGNSANVSTSANTTGTGSVVSINQGVFYVDGYFVTVSPQTIVLDPYTSTPTYRIGLEIDEEIVTESVDNALLDPAQEAFNYQAPGGHRYQFNLVLTKRTLDSVDDSRFFELLRVENGIITRQVSYPIYSELEKTFARRTYDESGNYAVKPFRVNLSANTPAGQSENTSTFIINIEPGKAYVKGFEFETIGTRKVSADRARTFKSNKDYDLSVYYGNRIQLANVLGSSTNGIVFSENLDEIDIHCVANNLVDLSSGVSSNHYTTRIGTAKLRNIEHTSSPTVFYVYLTDINFTPIISLTGGSGSNVRTVNLGSNFSSTDDAYVGGTVTMIDQIAGEAGKILAYDGTTKIATLDRDLTQTLVVSQRFSLSMPVSSAESILIANTTSLTSANLQANISSTSKDVLGNAQLEDTSFNKMVFELPNYYIRYDSDTNVDLYRKKIVKNQSFATNGALTLALTGSETYDFGTVGQLISNADVIENIIVVPTTGTTPGQIVDLTTSSRSVSKTTTQSITIHTNSASGATFTGDVYVTTKVTNANGGFRRTKTLIQSNSALTANDTSSSATSVSGYANVKINTSNGITWFTTSDVIVKNPSERQSLFIADVVKINKIYDSGNTSHAPNTSNMIDITDRYSFDSGQTDNYYDHAAIILKPGSSAPTGQTAVLFDYYTHTGTGYLSAKSYDSAIYESEQIPIYQSISGKNYNLRDCIDLRPIREPGTTVAPYKTAPVDAYVNVTSGGITVTANTSLSQNTLIPPIVTGTLIKVGNDYRTVNAISNLTSVNVSSEFSATSTNVAIDIVTQNYDFGGSIIQRPTDPIELDYDYYLPRIDKLIVTKDKEFKILTGVPSLTPRVPAESEDAMAIYTLYIPPYTASLQSVDLKFIDNRRYTMKDISGIDNRLKQVESFIALNKSEKQVIQDPPKSPVTPTINKPIYGTLVDEFDDLTIADTYNDFAASIEKGRLSTYKHITQFNLKTTSTGNNVRDKFITISYTETPFAEQKLATSSGNESVQSTMIAKFEGFVTLTPESDYFYSLEHQPLVTDSIGRAFELRQSDPPEELTFTSSYVEALGGGGYFDQTYNNVVISTQSFPINVRSVFQAPAYAASVADINSPVFQSIDINIAGVAPETFLNETWTGKTFITESSNPMNIFTPDWTRSGLLAAENFAGKFD